MSSFPSPDGKLVAYASDRAGEGNLDIWVHPLTQGARPIRLTNDPSDDLDPSFSPDGGQIVFHSRRADGGIYLVPSLGGDERLLVRGGYFPRFSTSGSHGRMESKVFLVPVAEVHRNRLARTLPLRSRRSGRRTGRVSS